MSAITTSSSAQVIPLRKKPPSFLKLGHSLLRGSLFISLPAEEQLLFIRIAARYNGRNNGKIPYSVRDAIKELHVSQTTVYRASHRLQDLGLVVCRKPGNRTGPSEWEIPELTARCISPDPVHVPPEIHPQARGVSHGDTKKEEKTLGVETERVSLPSEARKPASGPSAPSDNSSSSSPSTTISRSQCVAAGTAAMAALELIERATRRPFRRDENGDCWLSVREWKAVAEVAAKRGRP